MNPTPYTQTGWSLADLFSAPDGADLEAAFVTLEAQMQAFESVREQLRSDLPAAEFLGYVQQLETLTLGMHRLNYYPSLRFAENTQDQNALTLMARVGSSPPNWPTAACSLSCGGRPCRRRRPSV